MFGDLKKPRLISYINLYLWKNIILFYIYNLNLHFNNLFELLNIIEN